MQVLRTFADPFYKMSVALDGIDLVQPLPPLALREHPAPRKAELDAIEESEAT